MKKERTELSRIQELDYVLKFFAENEFAVDGCGYALSEQYVQQLMSNDSLLLITQQNYRMIIEKLVKDGNLMNLNGYTVTLEGKILNDFFGYEHKLKWERKKYKMELDNLNNTARVSESVIATNNVSVIASNSTIETNSIQKTFNSQNRNISILVFILLLIQTIFFIFQWNEMTEQTKILKSQEDRASQERNTGHPINIVIDKSLLDSLYNKAKTDSWQAK